MTAAMYPGTFDPITLGHEELVRRISSLFDEVIVAIASSPRKDLMFSIDERIHLAKEVLSDLQNVNVIAYEGLTVDFAQKNNIQVVVRGLRSALDFDYELRLADMNRSLSEEIETIFLTPNKYAFVSSSLVREIASMGGDVSKFVSPVVQQALVGYFQKT
jgi:pantetheine-phosphate adenylyltransferase|tara:strand:- start:2828 stop:3307 length:480 start_codon:yes stop_codon:yes gene_type:complete